MFFVIEGINGHLPNLDFINSISWIIRDRRMPAVLHSSTTSALTSTSILNSMPILKHLKVLKEFETNSQNLWNQLLISAKGGANGPESVYGRYRIDAVTLFGIPGEGPYGFNDLGK